MGGCPSGVPALQIKFSLSLSLCLSVCLSVCLSLSLSLSLSRNGRGSASASKPRLLCWPIAVHTEHHRKLDPWTLHLTMVTFRRLVCVLRFRVLPLSKTRVSSPRRHDDDSIKLFVSFVLVLSSHVRLCRLQTGLRRLNQHHAVLQDELPV